MLRATSAAATKWRRSRSRPPLSKFWYWNISSFIGGAPSLKAAISPTGMAALKFSHSPGVLLLSATTDRYCRGKRRNTLLTWVQFGNTRPILGSLEGLRGRPGPYKSISYVSEKNCCARYDRQNPEAAWIGIGTGVGHAGVYSGSSCCSLSNSRHQGFVSLESPEMQTDCG